jgi:hypothetical protein
MTTTSIKLLRAKLAALKQKASRRRINNQPPPAEVLELPLAELTDWCLTHNLSCNMLPTSVLQLVFAVGVSDAQGGGFHKPRTSA